MRHNNSYSDEGKDNIIKRIGCRITSYVRGIKAARNEKSLAPVILVKHVANNIISHFKACKAEELKTLVKTPAFQTVTLFVLLVFCSSWFFFIRPLYYERVYQGIKINNINVGGLSKEELSKVVDDLANKYRNNNIVFYYGEADFAITGNMLEVAVDEKEIFNMAWSYGRQGNWLRRIITILETKKNSYAIMPIIKYNEDKLVKVVADIKVKIDKKPRNAKIVLSTQTAVDEENGRSLDEKSFKDVLEQALAKSSLGKILIPFVNVKAAVTQETLSQSGIKELVASYSTYFNEGDLNRNTNIKVAADRINGYILHPGQTFSFNEIVGPREKVYGFREAMEIVNGELVPGIGGGVCQVSSTLYNSVLLASLNITERANHCKPLGYIPLGRDATVAYGSLDFKFINNTKKALMITSELQANKLTVGIFGTKNTNETIEIATAVTRELPPEVVKKVDKDIYLGDVVLEKKGSPGYEVDVIRIKKQAGKQVSSELISHDIYMPDNTIIKVGSKLKSNAKN